MVQIFAIGSALHPSVRASLLGLIPEVYSSSPAEYLLKKGDAESNYGVPLPKPAIVKGYRSAFIHDLSSYPELSRIYGQHAPTKETQDRNFVITLPDASSKVIGVLFEAIDENFDNYRRMEGDAYRWEEVGASSFPYGEQTLGRVWLPVASKVNDLRFQGGPFPQYFEYVRRAAYRLGLVELEPMARLPEPLFASEWDSNTHVIDGNGKMKTVEELTVEGIYPKIKLTRQDFKYLRLR